MSPPYYEHVSTFLCAVSPPYYEHLNTFLCVVSPTYCHTRLHLGFSAKLRIWQVPTCKMEPRSGIIITLVMISPCSSYYKPLLLSLPHSAPSWILSLAENLASSNLQDGATKWHYYLNSYHIACATDPPHSLRNRPIVLVVTNIFDLVRCPHLSLNI